MVARAEKYFQSGKGTMGATGVQLDMGCPVNMTRELHFRTGTQASLEVRRIGTD